MDIPLRAYGNGPDSGAEYHYRIGTFTGRRVSWSLTDDPEIAARLRIPEEKFRHDEELFIEVFAKGTKAVLWQKSWRVIRRGEILGVEPLEPGFDYRGPEPDRRPKRYRTQGERP